MNNWLPGSAKVKEYQKEYQRAWRQRRKDPEKMAAYRAEMEANKPTPEQRVLMRRARWMKWKKAHPELHRQRVAEQHVKHKERRNKVIAAYQKAHPEKVCAKSAKWRANNRARFRETCLRYAKAHPEVAARYRSQLVRAMPSWADEKKISEMYAARVFAQAVFEKAIHVDHIVPLNSPLVCGLHCEDNLQLLTQVENARKKNRYWPDMWSN